jgi:hypothetical protein
MFYLVLHDVSTTFDLNQTEVQECKIYFANSN